MDIVDDKVATLATLPKPSLYLPTPLLTLPTQNPVYSLTASNYPASLSLAP